VALHKTAARLQERLRRFGLDVEVRELADSTRTAAEAAAAVGGADGPVVCLCAGDRRVDAAKLGDGARPARADEVREATGFAIGGVPPLGHDRPLPTVVDESLRRFGVLWCAAGTPHAVFSVETEQLLAALPDATVADVTEE